MGNKVLIVDDSPIVHNLLKKILLAHDYVVCGDAKNGQEGIDLYEELKPDIVFMDITMPIKDGIEASQEIKTKYPDSFIVMLTAMGDDEIKEQAKNVGINVFLQKPFDDYKVISALSNQ